MATKKSQVKESQEMVEKMGVFFEKAGLAPMPGRVFAYLLLAEPPQKDFYEIQEFLKASKSAISNALKFLQNRGMVEYLTISGDRRRYFKVDAKGWLETTRADIASTAHFKVMIENVLKHRAGSKHLDFNEQLEEMVEFYEALDKNLITFMKKWDARK